MDCPGCEKGHHELQRDPAAFVIVMSISLIILTHKMLNVLDDKGKLPM